MNTALQSVLSNRKVVALSGAAIGFVAGGVAGILITRRLIFNALMEELDNTAHDAKMERLQRRFDPNFTDFSKPREIREAKLHSLNLTPVEPGAFNEVHIVGKTFEEAQAEADEINARVEAARHHTFDTPTDDWNYETELNVRSTKEIYVIHRDEYVRDEMGYHQSTIEFYTQDAVMTDALQHPIYNYTDFVGDEALDMFGHGSGDADVVYVRNDREKAEFEVLRNHGSYEREVLGLETEEEYREQDLKHSRYPNYKFPIRE